jgi:hypothetical protein
MGVTREGGCACRSVRYRISDEPLVTHCCHCLNCQRQTGSAFAINLMVEADRVAIIDGDPQPVDVPRDNGGVQRIYRCPRCQAAVFSEYGWPELWYVRAGTLDEPWSVTPDVHIFTKSKVPWLSLSESIPAFDVYYERDAVWSSASVERIEAVIAQRRTSARS